MKKIYEFEHPETYSSARFIIDTERFTRESAQDNLDFFGWHYNHDADPIDEIMKKYALEAIFEAYSNYSVYGVKNAFKRKEGFTTLNGETGILLTHVAGIEIFSDDLQVSIENIDQ